MTQFESELLDVLASIDQSLRQLSGRQLDKSDQAASASRVATGGPVEPQLTDRDA